jgi:hypothetical protein
MRQRIDPTYVAVANGLWRGETVGPQPVGHVKRMQHAAADALTGLASKPKALNAQARHAARNGDAGKLRELLDKGADPNAPSKGKGYTVAHEAARSSNPAVMAVLIERGGLDLDKRATIAPQATPLHIAAILGNQPVAEMLITHGANQHLEATSLREADNPALRDIAGCTPALAAERVTHLRDVRAATLGRRGMPTVEDLDANPLLSVLAAPPTFHEVGNQLPSYGEALRASDPP